MEGARERVDCGYVVLLAGRSLCTTSIAGGLCVDHWINHSHNSSKQYQTIQYNTIQHSVVHWYSIHCDTTLAAVGSSLHDRSYGCLPCLAAAETLNSRTVTAVPRIPTVRSATSPLLCLA